MIKARTVHYVFLFCIVALIGLGFLDRISTNDFYSLSSDRSLSELFESLLLLGSALLSYRLKDGFFKLVSVILFYIALDNILSIHETVGHLIAQLTAVTSQALGEFIYLSVLVIILCFPLYLTLRKVSPKHIVSVAGLISGGLLLILFGALFDYLHMIAPSSLSYFIEDMGELVGIVVIFLGLVVGSSEHNTSLQRRKFIRKLAKMICR